MIAKNVPITKNENNPSGPSIKCESLNLSVSKLILCQLLHQVNRFGRLRLYHALLHEAFYLFRQSCIFIVYDCKDFDSCGSCNYRESIGYRCNWQANGGGQCSDKFSQGSSSTVCRPVNVKNVSMNENDYSSSK